MWALIAVMLAIVVALVGMGIQLLGMYVLDNITVALVGTIIVCAAGTAWILAASIGIAFRLVRSLRQQPDRKDTAE